MDRNLYKYWDVLDTINNSLVSIQRELDLEKIIRGLKSDNYWIIYAPGQTGKTTFLNQLKYKLPDFLNIYINFKISPQKPELFYPWLQKQIEEGTNSTLEKVNQDNSDLSCLAVGFLKFLMRIKPKVDKKLILLFDGIEGLPAEIVRSFLRIWRIVFQIRNDFPELKKYSIVIASTIDSIYLTKGTTSTFSIAKALDLCDFTQEQTNQLLDIALDELNIKFNLEVRKRLFDLTSGHPQLLQHLCNILVKEARQKNEEIKLSDLDKALDTIFSQNENLKLRWQK